MCNGQSAQSWASAWRASGPTWTGRAVVRLARIRPHRGLLRLYGGTGRLTVPDEPTYLLYVATGPGNENGILTAPEPVGEGVSI